MPRRILLLITDLKIGGTPTVVREIATRLHRPPDVLVHVACLDRWGPVADQLTAAGVPVTALAARGAKDVRVVGRLIGLIRREGIDTVFSFLVHANAVAAVASVRCRGVRFLQSIQTTQPRPRWHWRVQRLAQRAAEAVVVPSESVATVAGHWAGVPSRKIKVIPNGVDLDAFIPTTPRHEPTSPPYRVVFLGRLDPVKRIPDLLTAIAQLGGFARLDVYGEGAERPALVHQIRTMRLEPWVTLHGSAPGPQDALAGADVLVLPSEAEGFGLVLIEAMAAGVPVVATDAPGIRDVVRHGVTGLLVPVGSPASLAVAIRKVLEDFDLRRSLLTHATADVRRRFAWERILRSYQSLLGLPIITPAP